MRLARSAWTTRWPVEGSRPEWARIRNAALANYMRSFGVIDGPVEYTLGVYYHHCAIAMTCRPATASSMTIDESWARNCMKRRISPRASRGW
jgi:glutaminase